jgi:hypothetical protein
MFILQRLQEIAKKEKRSIADEVSRRIGRTFKTMFEIEYRVIACELKPQLKEIAFDGQHKKCISREILEALQDSAAYEGHSLDFEVALRLGATLERPDIFEADNLMDKMIVTRKTQSMEIVEKQQYALCCAKYYECRKLRDLVEALDRLPKDFKEQFHYIDVEAEVAIILEEKALEAKNNSSPEISKIKHDWNKIKKAVEVILYDNPASPEAAKPEGDTK